jgi:alpha-glucosidase
MNTKKAQIILLLIAVIQSASIFTTNAQVSRTSNGILVKTGGKQIGLMAVNDGAFCLSLNDSIAPGIIKSVFIDDSSDTTTPYTVISAPPFYEIKTSYGKLMINTATQMWSLYDAAGGVLIRDGAYAATDSSIEIAHTAKGLLYGSGNRSTRALEKNESASAVGNGVAGIPYFWSNAGYSAFAVSVNDDQPATWNRDKDKTALTWKFAGKAANLYLWPAKTMYAAAKGYVLLTGRPKLPPRWAFGYLQSKWGWDDSTYIAGVATRFRADKLPVDAFIYDFEWYTTLPDYAVKKEGKEGFSVLRSIPNFSLTRPNKSLI